MGKFLQWNAILALILCLLAGSVMAQERTISGRVVSGEDGSALPGVNVVVKGTTNGTVTDADGNYRVAATGSNIVLVFSFIGLQTQEASVGERSTVDVSMAADVTQLAEIVVTSQGIEKETRALGYALQSVNGSSLAQRSEPNVLSSLQGKVAGVNIVTASGAPGASSNINIRGITSFGGSNQPLIVVDGIIFSNSVDGGTSVFTTQPSNRLADIAPENIESINILKGPAAAVLYGSRASSGAIVITTKSGKRLGGKTEISFTSSYNTQAVYGWPALQNEYGQGINNDYLNNSSNSWGPSFANAPASVIDTQGRSVPYESHPDEIMDWFKRGSIVQNGLQVASGNADNNVALSVSSTLQNGIVPNSSFDRNSIQFGGSSKTSNGIMLSASVTYVKTKQTGNPQGNGGSALGQMTRIPRSYDLVGPEYQDPITGRSIYYSLTQNHPLWSTDNETSKSEVDRIFGYAKIGYNITDWLNVTYRITGDSYTDRRKTVYQIGSARNLTGRITENMYYNTELNGDLMINASKDNLFVEGLSANLLLGHNINQRKTQDMTVDGQSMTVPFFDNINGTTIYTGSSELSTLRRLIGYYGQLSLSYNGYLFVELSGRADQSSTLPVENNLYFYPAISASFVITDALGVKSDILSNAKIRASVAKVGRDANPYLLKSVFVPAGYGNNVANVTFPMTVGSTVVPGFTPSNRIGNDKLTPEFTKSYDGGIVVNFLDNRIGLDVGYFYTESINQIFNVAVSNSSGFNTKTSNVGLMTNKGWEVVLNATILKIGDFSWDLTANYTRIRNKVVTITEDDIENENSAIPGNSNFIGMIPSIWEGQPYGVIVGTANTRNENGDILINPATGLFATGTAGKILADPNPDWLLGVTNTFSFKGITLQALVDTRQGGQVLSFGNVDLRSQGHLLQTAVDRELPRVLPGVIANGDGTFRPNNIQISAQSYWQNIGGLGSEAGIFDATVYRFRELSLSYSLPVTWLSKTPITAINIGVSGRNLWFHAPGTPSDPELNIQGQGNAQGLDQSGAPNTRNFGGNLKITF